MRCGFGNDQIIRCDEIFSETAPDCTASWEKPAPWTPLEVTPFRSTLFQNPEGSQHSRDACYKRGKSFWELRGSLTQNRRNSNLLFQYCRSILQPWDCPSGSTFVSLWIQFWAMHRAPQLGSLRTKRCTSSEVHPQNSSLAKQYAIIFPCGVAVTCPLRLLFYYVYALWLHTVFCSALPAVWRYHLTWGHCTKRKIIVYVQTQGRQPKYTHLIGIHTYILCGTTVLPRWPTEGPYSADSCSQQELPIRSRASRGHWPKRYTSNTNGCPCSIVAMQVWSVSSTQWSYLTI